MRNKIFEYLWIPIGIASFFLYSSQFFPLLNSDDALNILMIKDLRLPQDLYAWGQDRGGSLIPLVGWPLHHLLGLSVVLSESIVHFLILFIGFWFLSRCLMSNMSKIILAIIWFFPTYWFFSLIRFPFGIQYSLIGVVVYLVFIQRDDQANGKFKMSSLVIVIFMLSLALWVSDLALTSILALIFIFVYPTITKKVEIQQVLKWPGLFITLGGVTLTVIFILFAKNHAIRTEFYNESIVNSFHNIVNSITILIKSLWNILNFRKETWMLSVFGIMVITLIPILLILRPKVLREQLNVAKFFLLDSFILLVVIILSHWAYLNDDSRRYFSGIYVGLSVVILLGIENLTGRKKNMIQVYALIIAIFGGMGSIHYLKNVYPKSLKPMINVVGELKSLGEIGIIGEYWNSYISACSDPDKIAATTHDGCFNRNPSQIQEVFSKPRLYIIKDMWMNKFSDSLVQYGYLLRRKGDSINLANCMINEYERVPRIQRFNPTDLMTIKGQAKTDSLSGKTIVYADSNCLECKWKHLVYGPGISLGIGKFEIGFYIRIEDIIEGKNIAVIDVTADFGKTKMSNNIIKPENVKVGVYQYYWLNFENITPQKDMEFRILYLGNSSIYFDHLILKERM
ncbi:MAG: hypothetical protein WC865_10680 [Bacteroidales bacterium]